MQMCETRLANYVDNPAVLNVLANVSEKAGAPWGVVSALKTFCKLHPGNEAKMRWLADAMQQNNQALDALKIHQELLKTKSNSGASLAQQAELRSAMALASIERGNFNDRRNAHANTADAEDAMIAQLLEGTIHDAAQAQVLINRFTAELKKNDSIDMRRKLADAYMVAEQFEEALQEYRTVAEKIGVMDPVLDKHIEKAYISQLKQNIEILKANPEAYENAEAQIADLENECKAYRWRHTVKRAEQFSGDMQLQFDLGVLQFENNMFAEAVETFTRVSDNPQKRRASLVYLGRCALANNQLDSAINFLEDAIKEMFRMDIQKREALYYLGYAYEMNGNKQEALEAYRKISVNMANYRDIQERMAALSEAGETN
jgi:tetratricopeptide (TPR) repeat protein